MFNFNSIDNNSFTLTPITQERPERKRKSPDSDKDKENSLPSFMQRISASAPASNPLISRRVVSKLSLGSSPTTPVKALQTQEQSDHASMSPTVSRTPLGSLDLNVGSLPTAPVKSPSMKASDVMLEKMPILPFSPCKSVPQEHRSSKPSFALSRRNLRTENQERRQTVHCGKKNALPRDGHIKEDDQIVAFKFQGRRYEAAALALQGKQHLVYRGTCEKSTLIFKRYVVLKGNASNYQIARDDVRAYEVIQSLLEKHSDLNVRLATIHGNPFEHGMLVMEYVPHDQDKNLQVDDQGHYVWDAVETFDQLPRIQQNILRSVKDVLQRMYENNFEIGDFVPNNVHWNNDQLVIIDYTASQEDDLEDSQFFHRTLARFVLRWANENKVVEDFLMKDMPVAYALKMDEQSV